jgi:hypothetical protein
MTKDRAREVFEECIRLAEAHSPFVPNEDNVIRGAVGQYINPVAEAMRERFPEYARTEEQKS